MKTFSRRVSVEEATEERYAHPPKTKLGNSAATCVADNKR